MGLAARSSTNSSTAGEPAVNEHAPKSHARAEIRQEGRADTEQWWTERKQTHRSTTAHWDVYDSACTSAMQNTDSPRPLALPACKETEFRSETLRSSQTEQSGEPNRAEERGESGARNAVTGSMQHGEAQQGPRPHPVKQATRPMKRMQNDAYPR